MDWGLGHATRCIPLIDSLIMQQHDVMLAGSGTSLQFLRDAYPTLEVVELPAYDIYYPEGTNASFQVLLQTPKVLRAIKKERSLIAEIYAVYKWDYIISDNRYGVLHPLARNIFICHQIAIRAPKLFSWTNPFFLSLHLRFIKPFHELWIPDIKGVHNLSGKLAHGITFPIPHHYIGVMSRFTNKIKHPSYIDDIDFEILIVLSGPEPQRSEMEAKLIKICNQQKKKTLLVRGKPDDEGMKVKEFVTLIPLLQTNDLLAAYHKAAAIICRSGYSTIMDLSVLNKKAIYIPTHGQTEQEYLAHLMQERKMGVVWQPDKTPLPDILKKYFSLNANKQVALYQNAFHQFIIQYHF